MKNFFIIFLLLTTAVYILPVKDFIKSSPGISITDLADEKEESIKEKPKEFITEFSPFIILTTTSCNNFQYCRLNLPAPLHTIETPPPDSYL
jgi:hypothetical protein